MTPKILLVSAGLLLFTGCASGHEFNSAPQETPQAAAITSPAPRRLFASRQIQRNIQRPPRQLPLPQAEPPLPETRQAPRELARHRTEFNSDEESRSHNISLAASSIDGHVVRPGEVFSFNETLGSTTRERGYKKGTIFVGGKKSEGYGGGVCQVSTTLYNAAANAGMTIVERHDHPQPVSYAEAGQEAATSHDGGLDFKFQNNKPFAVRINSKAENGTISVTINEE